MGLLEKLKHFLIRRFEDEALQSASTALQSDLKRSNQRFKALESAANFTNYSEKQTEEYHDKTPSGFTKLSQPLELQKESLQLGVAAGYTGKSIKEIESSLARIESQMTSKDWFVSNFEDRTPELVELLSEIKNNLEKHDSNVLKRFESIESALNRMAEATKDVPEPIKAELTKEIDTIRSNLPLTSKMKQLIQIVKDVEEISYDDLCKRLEITRSSLRGLLANTMKRSTEVERYSVAGKGYVKYKY
jgi:archaellum component FlaC